nr:hypothetical protein Itr_chr03CG11170 [Ipomoea trifida]
MDILGAGSRTNQPEKEVKGNPDRCHTVSASDSDAQRNRDRPQPRSFSLSQSCFY